MVLFLTFFTSLLYGIISFLINTSLDFIHTCSIIFLRRGMFLFCLQGLCWIFPLCPSRSLPAFLCPALCPGRQTRVNCINEVPCLWLPYGFNHRGTSKRLEGASRELGWVCIPLALFLLHHRLSVFLHRGLASCPGTLIIIASLCRFQLCLLLLPFQH